MCGYKQHSSDPAVQVAVVGWGPLSCPKAGRGEPEITPWWEQQGAFWLERSTGHLSADSYFTLPLTAEMLRGFSGYSWTLTNHFDTGDMSSPFL